MNTKHTRYNRSEKGLARYSRYNKSAKGLARDAKYRGSPSGNQQARIHRLTLMRKDIVSRLEELNGLH